MDELKDGSAAVAKLCARILDENKLENVKVFDVGSALQITDYFVIASGRTPRHIKAASDELLRRLRERGSTRRGLEGYREGKWVLIDLDGVVVHLFLSENREFYDLEHLWGDCPAVDWLEGWTMPPRSPARRSPALEAEGSESAARVSAGGR